MQSNKINIHVIKFYFLPFSTNIFKYERLSIGLADEAVRVQVKFENNNNSRGRIRNGTLFVTFGYVESGRLNQIFFQTSKRVIDSRNVLLPHTRYPRSRVHHSNTY